MKLDMLMILVRLIFSSLQTETINRLSPFLLNCDKKYSGNSKKGLKEKRIEQLLVQSDGVNFLGENINGTNKPQMSRCLIGWGGGGGHKG
jgi:hypothetical protein